MIPIEFLNVMQSVTKRLRDNNALRRRRINSRLWDVGSSRRRGTDTGQTDSVIAIFQTTAAHLS
jgi:hypothetical protein